MSGVFKIDLLYVIVGTVNGEWCSRPTGGGWRRSVRQVARRVSSIFELEVSRKNARDMPSKSITPKQPKARVLRARRKREPQVHEPAKKAIVIKGRKTSQDVNDALKDLVSDRGSSSCPTHTAFPVFFCFNETQPHNTASRALMLALKQASCPAEGLQL